MCSIYRLKLLISYLQDSFLLALHFLIFEQKMSSEKINVDCGIPPSVVFDLHFQISEPKQIGLNIYIGSNVCNGNTAYLYTN